MYVNLNLLTVFSERVIWLKRSDMKKFVQSLSADEAARVLSDLLESDPTLLRKAHDFAMRVTEDVDADAIMNRVFNGLDSLELDDLSGRAGRTRYGYVDPGDAAWELFEEVLDPFIEEMKKNQKRSLPAVAKAHCIGIIKGIWRYDKESTSDFAGWVEDAPGEYVDTVIDEWKKGNPTSEDIAEVMSIAWGNQS
jgi:hypothetical protein